jgi:hypothetical protein
VPKAPIANLQLTDRLKPIYYHRRLTKAAIAKAEERAKACPVATADPSPSQPKPKTPAFKARKCSCGRCWQRDVNAARNILICGLCGLLKPDWRPSVLSRNKEERTLRKVYTGMWAVQRDYNEQLRLAAARGNSYNVDTSFEPATQLDNLRTQVRNTAFTLRIVHTCSVCVGLGPLSYCSCCVLGNHGTTHQGPQVQCQARQSQGRGRPVHRAESIAWRPPQEGARSSVQAALQDGLDSRGKVYPRRELHTTGESAHSLACVFCTATLICCQGRGAS